MKRQLDYDSIDRIFGFYTDEETRNSIDEDIYFGLMELISAREKIPAWNKGLKGVYSMSESTKQKLSVINTGKKLSEDHKRKIGKSNSISKIGTIPWNKGKSYTKEFCDKFSKTYEVTFPDGHSETITNMTSFCKMHSLQKSNMSLVANGKQNSHKGFKVRKIT